MNTYYRNEMETEQKCNNRYQNDRVLSKCLQVKINGCDQRRKAGSKGYAVHGRIWYTDKRPQLIRSTVLCILAAAVNCSWGGKSLDKTPDGQSLYKNRKNNYDVSNQHKFVAVHFGT